MACQSFSQYTKSNSSSGAQSSQSGSINQSVAAKLDTGTGWPPCRVHFKLQWCQWDEQPPCY
ncbi:hypothetical protein H5410_010233 [Solanum commersonii]|uniref:Uncharacterized protein n=1 Tax=Solanum commersonii TaxID=4109 RepID=A0A9J6ALW6_SOLCO|nr:hypothetical protein H5410_010233 [Solanum commersonii]